MQDEGKGFWRSFLTLVLQGSWNVSQRKRFSGTGK